MVTFFSKKLSEKLVLLTGLTAENTRLNLSKGADRTSLTMTRLNLGFKYQHSEKWSGTYVLLPKIASDFNAIGSNDFQIGALAVLDYQYSESYKIKFNKLKKAYIKKHKTLMMVFDGYQHLYNEYSNQEKK